jgi:hypothetical protein
MSRALSIAVALVLVCAGCGKNNESTTAPTTSTTKSETFTGSVAVRGSAMNTFSVTAAGQVLVTLTAAGPPATVPVGLGLGSPGDVCGILPGGSVTAVAAANAQLSGILTPGTYCVTVFDVGNQTGAITYSVTVVHP